MIATVDEFILYDDVQFTKNDWRNRNQSFVHYIFPIIHSKCEQMAFIAEDIDEIRSVVARIKKR